MHWIANWTRGKHVDSIPAFEFLNAAFCPDDACISEYSMQLSPQRRAMAGLTGPGRSVYLWSWHRTSERTDHIPPGLCAPNSTAALQENRRKPPSTGPWMKMAEKVESGGVEFSPRAPNFVPWWNVFSPAQSTHLMLLG